MQRYLFAAFAIALAAGLIACGGSSGSNAGNAAANNAAAAPSAPGAMMDMGGTTGAAPVPSSLDCGAVKPVWANTSTKKYHEPGDPYYGKTKHGEYLCPAQAKKDGFRPAGGSAKAHHRSRQ
ncbi:MAG TPA: hypothetical protein VMH02_13305 [Verrucomicrobiae bacterium]|nr:hypothetical protein [Verrucomicrobiae bacterium]